MAIDICGASTGGTSEAGTRERRVCVAYTVNATLLAALLVAVLVSGCGPGVQEQFDAHKAAATQLLVQNGRLREFLKNVMYELSGNVFITTDPDWGDKSAVILTDGKLVIPDGNDYEWYEAVRQYEPTIVEVFDKFDCEFIALFQPDSINPNKTLKVEFKGFKIGGNRYYAESLYYSRDGAVEMAESVLTDWYYSALLYQ
jgi:hypothetical protein